MNILSTFGLCCLYSVIIAFFLKANSHQTFASSKSTIEKLEKGVKHKQS